MSETRGLPATGTGTRVTPGSKCMTRAKTRTRQLGYGYSQVRVWVPGEIPRGYPGISLKTFADKI
jgi:hypothetical protein